MLDLQTVFCQILGVQPLPTAGDSRWAVTIGDGEGKVVTLELDDATLQAYERFQAAVHRQTGHTFRYLPFGTSSDAVPLCPLAVELTRLATRSVSSNDPLWQPR